jgi:hypothetical protein
MTLRMLTSKAMMMVRLGEVQYAVFDTGVNEGVVLRLKLKENDEGEGDRGSDRSICIKLTDWCLLRRESGVR